MSEWKTLDCAWTSSYHYCLSERMKGRKIQDTWRDEGKQSSSVPALQIPYLTSLYWATTGLQILLPGQKSQEAIPLLSQKSLPSAETWSCTKGLYFQEILLIPLFSGRSQGTASAVSHPVFSLSRGALVLRSLCSPRLIQHRYCTRVNVCQGFDLNMELKGS